MEFNFDKAIEILVQTPHTLSQMLSGLSDEWTVSTGDRDDWSPFDAMGHLIHCEKTDWIPRASVIMEQTGDRKFAPFDRFGQFEISYGNTMNELLDNFVAARNESLVILDQWDLNPKLLLLKGIHSEIGEVTLSQLLSTWVVHDLSHTRQIVTYMAKKYKDAVGPWASYMSILN